MSLQANAQFEFIKDFKFFHRGGELKKHSIAKLGYGLPYGGAGAQVEVGTNRVSIYGGAGLALMKDIDADFGFQLGMRLNLFKFEKKIRPRIGAYYGTNQFFKDDNSDQHTARGYGLSIGYEHRINDFLYYDLDYTFAINSTNSYRPTNLEHENVAFPSFGIGILLFSSH